MSARSINWPVAGSCKALCILDIRKKRDGSVMDSDVDNRAQCLGVLKSPYQL